VEIIDTFDFLLGSWKLSRSIEDHRSGIRGSFRGTAVLAAAQPQPQPHPEGGRASYDEAGEMSFGAYTGPASRHLEYATRPGSGLVAVSFADGRPFFDLDLSSGRWQGIHPCRDDRYELAFVVRSPDVVEERWHVTGPAKDYDAVTILTRA
jgi:Family of unknown function (DUF6314)